MSRGRTHLVFLSNMPDMLTRDIGTGTCNMLPPSFSPSPPRRHSHRRWESSPVPSPNLLGGKPAPFSSQKYTSLPAVILAEGGNPECGLGLDSRGGHENDGKRKTRTTPGMTIALPGRHSHRRWESSPVLSPNLLGGKPAPFSSQKYTSLPAVILAEGGNPECGLGLDSRGKARG